MVTHVISLPHKGEARRKILLPRLTDLSIPYIVIDAVDGTQLAERDLPVMAVNSAESLGGRPGVERITTNEVACLMSHRKAWQTIVSSNQKFALVIEDDALPLVDGPALEKLANEVIWHNPEAWVIQLQGKDAETLLGHNYGHYHETNGAPMGAFAYIITASGCRELLRLTRRLEQPTDVYFRSLSLEYIGFFVTDEPLFSHNDGGVSQLKPDRSGLILGLGTGRSGTKSVAKLFNLQENCAGYHERLVVPFDCNRAWGIHFVERMLGGDGTGTWPYRFEAASWYLHYAAFIMDRASDAKIVVMERDPDEVVKSFMRLTETPYRNHWQPHDGANLDKYFNCFPTYDPGLKKEVAIRKYVDAYGLGVNYLKDTYGDRVRKFSIKDLNDTEACEDLLRWAGVNPTNLTQVWIK